MNTKRMVLISLFVALAIALNIFERAIYIPAHPGVKLGLANVITLLSILILGWKDSLYVVFLRCSLGALLGGNPISFLFSITGGILSAVIMIILWRLGKNHISIVNISMIGAVTHNIGQLFVASLIMQDFSVYILLPVLMISALVTGYTVGLLTNHVYKIMLKRNLPIAG